MSDEEGRLAESFRALDLKGPCFKSSSPLLSGFVLGSPELCSVNSKLISLSPVVLLYISITVLNSTLDA